MTGIGTNAFKDCASLTNVTVLATVPPSLGGGAFSGCDGLENILVPWETGDDYRAASDWSEYAEMILEMPGSAENPWTVGPSDNPDGTVAWRDEDGNVYFKPPRSAVSRTGLEAVTNAMGGTSFTATKLIAADGSETNDLVMVLGASGTVYDTIADALAADETSYTLLDTEGAYVEFNAMGGVHTNGLEVLTNFFVSAYTLPETPTRTNYTFLGWYDGWTNNAPVVTNGQPLLRYVNHSLYAKWQSTRFEPSDTEVIKTDGAGVIVTQDVKTTGVLVLPEMNLGGSNGVANVAVGEKAFLKNVGLTSVTLPLFVKEVRDYAFANSTGISEINFVQPRDATTGEKTTLTIGKGAFSGLSITNLVIPAYVKSVGELAFSGNTKLAEVTIMGPTAIDWAKRPFLNCGTKAPGGKVTLHLAYEVATNKTYATELWNYIRDYANNIQIDYNPYGTVKVLDEFGSSFVEFEAKIDTPWPKVGIDSVKVLTTTELTGSDLETTWTTLTLTAVEPVASKPDTYRATFADQGEGTRFYRVAIVMPEEN